MFVGKNPWQSHGFPRARAVLKEIANDPDRALIVIDPRRTETAELADFHLQVRPGHRRVAASPRCSRVLVRRTCSTDDWLAEHADGVDERARRSCATVADRRRTARVAGVDEELRARGRPPHRRGGERVDLRGPRHPEAPHSHAQLATSRSCSGCSPATSRKPGGDEHPHRASRSLGGGGKGGGDRRTPGGRRTASSPASCPAT